MAIPAAGEKPVSLSPGPTFLQVPASLPSSADMAAMRNRPDFRSSYSQAELRLF